MEIIIDRFEGDYAVAELPDGAFADMPRALLPEDAAEGSVVTIEVNHEETEKRRKAASEMMNKLFGKRRQK